MFRPQIAMPIHDVSLSHALGQKFSPLAQKVVLRSVNVVYRSGWNPKARVEQNAAIVREAAPQLCHVNGGRNERRSGATVELR
jgi:hypothetical protein